MNLMGKLQELNDIDQKFLCFILTKQLGMPIHLGNLPFVEFEAAIRGLETFLPAATVPAAMQARRANLIKKKLLRVTGKITVTMFLDDFKVAKGSRRIKAGEFETFLPMTARKTAGLQWNEFKKSYVRPDVMVKHKAYLRKIGKNSYQVTLDEKVEVKAREYLAVRYGINAPSRY